MRMHEMPINFSLLRRTQDQRNKNLKTKLFILKYINTTNFLIHFFFSKKYTI